MAIRLGVTSPPQAFLRDGAASALSAEDELAQDRQREGVIVFTGSLAQFLPPGDEKVRRYQCCASLLDPVPCAFVMCLVPLGPDDLM